MSYLAKTAQGVACYRVDDRYLVTIKEKTYTLHEIRQAEMENVVVIALYSDPLELVSDLINHSLRRKKVNDISGLIEETQRLANMCRSFIGGGKRAL